MGGHIHLAYVRLLGEHHENLPRRIWAVQAGTAVSSRVRGTTPNSVNVVRHSAEELVCSVERWYFDIESALFKCVNTERLLLDRSRTE